MKTIFQQAKKNNVPKSTFDMSHEHKFSAPMGKLLPVLCKETLPGDRWKIRHSQMIRFSPLISPVYHRINVHINSYYIPMRLVWEGFEKFIKGDDEFWNGEGKLLPSIDLEGQINIGTVADYLGIPTGTYNNGGTKINMLPFLAYQAIWNEYYRNTKFEEEYPMDPDEQRNQDCLQWPVFSVMYEKDYFTTATPYAQKGDEVVLGGTDFETTKIIPKPPAILGDGESGVSIDENGNLLVVDENANYVEGQVVHEITVKELRWAEALQKVLEKFNRAGDKYIDYLKEIWGEGGSDLRIDRPQHLGGGKYPVVVSEVLNTVGQMGTELAPEGLPQGNMSGHGISTGSDNIYCECEEHGFIITMMHILPETGYFQGLERMWTRQDWEDYPIPDYARIGAQEIYKRELLFRDIVNHDTDIFGYQERYGEWKTALSKATGAFRTTLKFWHLMREFDKNNTVDLNVGFIRADSADFTRIFAVEDLEIEQLYCQVYFDAEVTRALPYNGDPSL